MNDLQKVQLDLLKQFVKICEKHHLRYYLFGGTCLGAIRHQGFIPWDDDLDVAMPRPDFDQLMKLHAEFSYPYFLQNIHTDPNYVYSFAKLRNSDTTFIEKPFAFSRINHGVWIDIFPLDGMSRKKGITKPKSFRPYAYWMGLMVAYACHQFGPIPFNKRFFPALGLDLLAIIFFPFRIGNWLTKAIEHSEKRISWDQASLVGPFLTAYLNRDAFPPAVFGEGTKAMFEGIEVMVPSDYKGYLSHIYGNYMKLPPIEKQVGHHVSEGFCLKTPYKTYLKKQ